MESLPSCLPTLIRSASRADAATERDPPPRRGGVRGDRPAGRVEGARRAVGTGRLTVDGARRAGRARAPRLAHASAHLGRPRADGARVPVLRRPPARAPRAASAVVSAPARRGAQRARDGAPVDDGHAFGAHATAGARVRAGRRDSDRAPRGGASAAAARRHDGRHHLHRIGHEAAVPVRPRRGSRARRLGGGVSQRADRRLEARLAESPPPPGRPVAPGDGAGVSRRSAAGAGAPGARGAARLRRRHREPPGHRQRR